MTHVLTSEDLVDILVGIAQGINEAAGEVHLIADSADDVSSAIFLDGIAKGLEMAVQTITVSGPVIVKKIEEGDYGF